MPKDAWGLFGLSMLAIAATAAVMAVRPFAAAPAFDSASVKPVFGWVTLALFSLTMVYVARKRQSLQWPGQLPIWRAAHTALGLMALISLFLHSGGKLGTGVSYWLVLLTVAILITGVWGIVVQGWIPGVMTGSLQDPVYKDELENDVGRLLREISAELDGRTPEFDYAYQRHILPAISITRPNEAQQRAFFERYDPTSPDINAAFRDLEHVSVNELEIFYSMAEKALDIIEIRRSQGYQRLMNQWLVWHIGFTSIIFAAMLMHIAASFIY